MSGWFIRLQPTRELVRVERITYPSKGEVESTVLVQAAGTHPDRPLVRVPARSLIRG